MTNICYCILQYNAYELTVKCVDSIMRVNQGKEYHILVVDNASKNNAYQIIAEKYKGIPFVQVCQTPSNLGFAKGNNYGYSIAKDTLKCDIIVMLNNDVEIDDSFNVEGIADSYERTHADVIAPDVINSKGYHQNPMSVKLLSAKDAIMSIAKSFLAVVAVYTPVFGKRFYMKYENRKLLELRATNKNIEKFHDHKFVPHGSCVVFTSNWIAHEKFAFVPKTFLFCEEDFLLLYILRNEYILDFDPSLRIYHMGEGSITQEYNDGRKRMKFMYFKRIKSLWSYLLYYLFNK